MKVVVNNEPIDIAAGDSLAATLRRLEIDAGAGTAVAVNRRVIPRDQWGDHRLADGADIVVLKATQGG